MPRDATGPAPVGEISIVGDLVARSGRDAVRGPGRYRVRCDADRVTISVGFAGAPPVEVSFPAIAAARADLAAMLDGLTGAAPADVAAPAD